MINKIFEAISILNKKSKKKFLKIVSLVVIGSFIETLSLYLIYQTIKYFSDPVNFINNQSLLYNFYNYFNLEKKYLIIFFLFCLIFIFLIKFLYFSFLYYKKFKFVHSLNANISTKILKNYLFQSFDFHLKSDSSKLIRNLRDEVSQFAHGAILQTLNLITEGIIFSSIILLLLYFETKFVLISLSFISLLGLIYYILIKSTFLKWGKVRQKFASISLKNAMESIHGIKDIKIFRSENFFLTNYFKSMRMLAQSNIIVHTLNQIPRLFLEVFVIIIVCFFIFYNFDDNLMDMNLLPSLGLFVAASFKLIPSISRILNSLNSLKFNLSATIIVKKELELSRNLINKNLNSNKNFYFREKIKLDNLSFKYSDRKYSVFENVNIEIKKNTIIGIMGNSGAGKSTLIDLIIGLKSPSTGQILIDGKNLKDNKDLWLKQIGYVPQKVYITNDTIKNNIALGLDENLINYEKIMDIIKICQLENFVGKLSDGIYTKLGDRGVVISGGELQRIGIARALYKNSELLILDEFTSALDDTNELRLIEILKDLSNLKTIIISSHKKRLFDLCDNIFLIKDKKISKYK
ncbi:ATP-binding cassette domain-containing protein [Candidatus Pelagibacter sp.]|uniref:ATP-binding cassette domain-containing protein n=1 Tax=Candidatus Pelagibacter sp. TaxID=2024849 RepID=UPI003F875637